MILKETYFEKKLTNLSFICSLYLLSSRSGNLIFSFFLLFKKSESKSFKFAFICIKLFSFFKKSMILSLFQFSSSKKRKGCLAIIIFEFFNLWILIFSCSKVFIFWLNIMFHIFCRLAIFFANFIKFWIYYSFYFKNFF